MSVLLALCVLRVDSALIVAIWCFFSILCRAISNATFIDVVEVVAVEVVEVVVVDSTQRLLMQDWNSPQSESLLQRAMSSVSSGLIPGGSTAGGMMFVTSCRRLYHLCLFVVLVVFVVVVVISTVGALSRL